MKNQTITQSIQFLQAMQKLDNIIDPDNMFTGAIQHLETFERKYILDSGCYIVEVSKDEYLAWLKFREIFHQEQSQELELEEH